MNSFSKPKMKPNPRRGSALIIALGLILIMTLLIAAVQQMTVSQLRTSEDERNYERALQMAESGLNAYLNKLANGDPANPPAWWPGFYTFDGGQPVPTIAQFKAGIANGTYVAKHYPAANSNSGFVVGSYGGLTTVGGTLLAYGWSGGAVRRVKVGVQSDSIFDWAALYGLDNLVSNQDFAWKFTGSANVVGAAGGEGLASQSNNATFYDGPIIWARGSFAAPFNNADPTVLASANGVPSGHVGAPGLASPLYRHYLRSLALPTADQDANKASGANTGVAWFQNNNNNTTGLRLLVQNTGTGVIRELPTPYNPPLIATNGSAAYQLTWPNSNYYKQQGMTASETPLGIRAYPGNYFFSQVNMQSSDVLYLRSFTDAERATIPAAQRQIMVSGDPANPNAGQAANQNIRFWIGHATSGTDPNSTFTWQTYMEYPQYASRFRTYVASNGTVNVKGINQNPPPPFRVNLLAYNQAANGSYYGNVSFASNVYLYGSLIGWQVTVSGGSTVQKETPEGAATQTNDLLNYDVISWQELP